MNLITELQNRFLAALSGLTDNPQQFASMVRATQDRTKGDFQANCAMPLGNQLKQPPREVAERIVELLDVADFCKAPEIAGPGFINLVLRDDWLVGQINQAVLDDRMGVQKCATPMNTIVDFSSPNVAKPMHCWAFKKHGDRRFFVQYFKIFGAFCHQRQSYWRLGNPIWNDHLWVQKFP